MRVKQSETKSGQGYKTLFYFGSLVFLFIFASLSIKVFKIIRDSKLADDRRFTVAVIAKKQSKIISVDTSDKTVSLVNVNGHLDPKKVGLDLGILADGIVLQNKDVLEEKPLSDYFVSFLIGRYQTTTLTQFDFLRLALFTNGVPKSNITEETFSLSENTSTINQLANRLFRDRMLDEEKLPIAIINATEVSGLGQRLERVLTSAGGNVVSVSSAVKLERFSHIYIHKKDSYTSEKLHSFLEFPMTITTDQGLSDIMIVLAEDSIHSGKF